MHCRDISEAEFDRIVAELVQAKHQGDDIEMVTGRHEDHGAVILIRDATRCMVFVDEPAHLERVRDETGRSVGRGYCREGDPGPPVTILTLRRKWNRPGGRGIHPA